jgi:hypothetical protein
MSTTTNETISLPGFTPLIFPAPKTVNMHWLSPAFWQIRRVKGQDQFMRTALLNQIHIEHTPVKRLTHLVSVSLFRV